MKRTIILYNPLHSPAPRPGIPLALLALARMVPGGTDRVRVVDASLDRRPHDTILSLAGDALILGVSAMTGLQIKDALKLAAKVKSRVPSLPIVWGGYHPSLLPEQTLESECVDGIVCGQGEEPFADLVARLDAGGGIPPYVPAPGPPGPDATSRDALARDDPPRDALDSYPFLAWDRIPLDRFPRAHDGAIAADFYTSQGCPHGCRFCAEPAMRGRHRFSMSPARAVEEIAHLHHLGVREIRLRDPLFFAEAAWVREFCERILHGDIRVRFLAANGRLDGLLRLEPQDWDLLVRAGFSEILMGIETAHPPAVRRIAKGIVPERSLELLARVEKHPIRFWISMMVGFPGVDPDAEFHDTIGLVRRLVAAHRRQISCVYVFSYAPYPGSALFVEARAHGFRLPATLAGWGNVDFHRTDYPWGSPRLRRQANLLTRRILPAVIGREPSRIRPIEVASRALDSSLRRRWESGRLGGCWEASVYDAMDGLRRARRRVCG
jgi:anaerobic magnesium-protoporphyrin IX monomethyl ester cyclase